ncbi:MAG: polysaccharide deacetylase family protein [Candidatus Omnitrophota bacterium]
MKFKLRYFIKISILFSISSSTVVSILFFGFIAPYRTVPILIYHSITESNQKNILTLTSNTFDKQMQYLSNHSYQVVTLKDIAERIKQGIDIPKNWVVLTFDDGYRDFYTNAYPILKRYRLKAAVFVIINSLNTSRNSMDWQLLEKLAKDDLIDIGEHCIQHIPLPLLGSQEVRDEIFRSKLILERRLRKKVISFAYPYGALTEDIKKVVQEAGFRVAVGTAYQRGEFKDNDIYILKRVFVSKISKYPFVFRFMLSGYYVPTREFILKVLNIKAPRDLYSAKRYNE